MYHATPQLYLENVTLGLTHSLIHDEMLSMNIHVAVKYFNMCITYVFITVHINTQYIHCMVHNVIQGTHISHTFHMSANMLNK